MKYWKVIATLVFMGDAFFASAHDTRESFVNETQQVHYAERVVMNELVRALSPSMRNAREMCSTACPETGGLELGIGLIGISRSDNGTNALINLLGLRLDGAGSEELSCQILNRGNTVLRPLEKLAADRISDHCRTSFYAARKRELAQVLDIQVEQVCRSELEILSVRDELVKAIKSQVKCEQQ
ncbi:Imm57 family immunity protein [Sulfuriferula thiophila]|uniref:Imm57 family immunity protein n=1 Tax=Sulfuriferula thiophila TaxID=1781211 RepID=UPI000F613988|nr:Imm57 family immunity protein [Sulfuriferula thiophila]